MSSPQVPRCDVREDVIDLAIGLLEAQRPIADGPDPAYPFPALTPTGAVEVRSFQTLGLENPFLRVVVVPDLGGRILSIFDKRTQSELLPRRATLEPQKGGTRGAILTDGIRLSLTGTERPNGMGRVASSLEPPDGEEDAAPGGIWIAETAMHSGLAFHLHLVLPADRAEIQFSVRVQNRTFQTLPYAPRFQFASSELPVGAPTTVLLTTSAAFVLTLDPDSLICVEAGDVVRVTSGWLAPRQVDTWGFTLTPFGLSDGLRGANESAAVRLVDDKVEALSIEDRSGHKLVLLTAEGQTLEAPVDLIADRLLSIPLDDLASPPRAVALLAPDGSEVVRTTPSTPLSTFSSTFPAQRPWDIDPDATTEDLKRHTLDPARRASVWIRLAQRAIAESDWAEADRLLEQSLLFNGDDPLAWWAKGMVKRLGGDKGEPTEILNAHYLAPLEPVLRADAFLAQPMSVDPNPSPLVAPLAESPEDLVEVAALLIEHGFLEAASRWIDEALRHHDLAMLHYFFADLLLTGPKLDMEAAKHVSAAARALVPPLPWRSVESVALERLALRFPTDNALVAILSLAHRNTSR